VGQLIDAMSVRVDGPRAVIWISRWTGICRSGFVLASPAEEWGVDAYGVMRGECFGGGADADHGQGAVFAVARRQGVGSIRDVRGHGLLTRLFSVMVTPTARLQHL